MPKYPKYLCRTRYNHFDKFVLPNRIWTLNLNFLKSMAPAISDTPLSNRYIWVSAYIISTSIIQLRKKTSLACSKKKYATILLTQQRQDSRY